MTNGEREKYALQLHQRLIERDPVAPAEFAEAFLFELVRRLRAKAGPGHEDTLFQDAATDTLLEFIQRPSKFNPQKSAVLTFLTMAAYRNLLNILAKKQRRQRKEVPLEVVEESLNGRNNILESETDNEVSMLDDLTVEKKTEILHMVEGTFPDRRDRAILDLMINGERRTSAFCNVLGIQALAPEEQKKIVKRHKDRITKRLQRLGGKIRGH